jgi:hypothetical protein
MSKNLRNKSEIQVPTKENKGHRANGGEFPEQLFWRGGKAWPSRN